MTDFILIHCLDSGQEQPMYISPDSIACFWKRNGVCAMRMKGEKKSMEVKELPEQIMNLSLSQAPRQIKVTLFLDEYGPRSTESTRAEAYIDSQDIAAIIRKQSGTIAHTQLLMKSKNWDSIYVLEDAEVLIKQINSTIEAT